MIALLGAILVAVIFMITMYARREGRNVRFDTLQASPSPCHLQLKDMQQSSKDIIVNQLNRRQINRSKEEGAKLIGGGEVSGGSKRSLNTNASSSRDLESAAGRCFT